MIITLSHPTKEKDPHYCRISPQYILHESAYSILCRFSLYNVIRGRELVSIFANKEPSARRSSLKGSPHLACVQTVDLSVMVDAFNLPIAKIHELFLCPTWVPFDRHVAEVLKFCPECLAQGRHYTIFQYGLVHQCPVHRIDLQQRCPKCSASARYSLSAQLFKAPYGCWRCGQQLGVARPKDALHFINAIGMARLRESYRAFELRRGQHLNFAIGGSEELYCDNVLKFSTSLREFSEMESVLFRRIQGLAANLSSKAICAEYSWFRWRVSHAASECSRAAPLTAQELRGTAKAIFRHFRKTLLGGFKLPMQALLPLWRSLECGEVPEDSYSATAWLDWFCFWSGVSTPSQLLDKNRAVNISKWLAEVRRHSVFLKCRDTCVQNWLTQRLFAHEVFTLLARQLAKVPQISAGGNKEGFARVVYERSISSVCWAVYFQSHINHVRIVFIPCPVNSSFHVRGTSGVFV